MDLRVKCNDLWNKFVQITCFDDRLFLLDEKVSNSLKRIRERMVGENAPIKRMNPPWRANRKISEATVIRRTSDECFT